MITIKLIFIHLLHFKFVLRPRFVYDANLLRKSALLYPHQFKFIHILFNIYFFFYFTLSHNWKIKIGENITKEIQGSLMQ